MKTRGIRVIVIGLAVVAAFSAIVMILWNLLLPDIFGLATISFWQAIGILILARIIFGGFMGAPGSVHRSPVAGFQRHNPIHEKWMKMSPEEREVFIKKRRECMHDKSFGREDFFNHIFGTDVANGSKQSDDK